MRAVLDKWRLNFEPLKERIFGRAFTVFKRRVPGRRNMAAPRQNRNTRLGRKHTDKKGA